MPIATNFSVFLDSKFLCFVKCEKRKLPTLDELRMTEKVNSYDANKKEL